MLSWSCLEVRDPVHKVVTVMLNHLIEKRCNLFQNPFQRGSLRRPSAFTHNVRLHFLFSLPLLGWLAVVQQSRETAYGIYAPQEQQLDFSLYLVLVGFRRARLADIC